MRRRLLTVATLALGVAAACCVSIRPGAADEAKSSWAARLWPSSWMAKKVPEGKKDAKGEPVKDIKADLDAARRTRAELDWKRRVEVCQKLRQIAFETNNDELERFAERLDQRAWDVYAAQLGGQAGGSGLSQDERDVAERIGVDFNLLSPGPKKTPSRPERAPEAP